MKKCIVLDLDNTLWGGVVGEDGLEQLQLSLEAPGNAYLAFQQALLDHYGRGVLLAINSRNNPADALAVIQTHPNMILKEHHFAAMRINWNDKAANIREIAEELNIGLDSLVFLDDDPTNRALVRSLVPEVETPELPVDPAEYARFLHNLDYFPKEGVTDEDQARGNLYVTERLRKEQEKKYASKEVFLKSLKLELHVAHNDEAALPRLAQLSEKTNQFNTHKEIFTEADLQKYVLRPDMHMFSGRLTDSFGDYGIVLFALIEARKSTWHIRSFLMSCRVFGRGAEDAFLSAIGEAAKAAGVETITIAWTETPKNAPAKTFVDARFQNGILPVSFIRSAPEWIHIV